MEHRGVEDSHTQTVLGSTPKSQCFGAKCSGWPSNKCICHQSIDATGFIFGVKYHCDMEKTVLVFTINSCEVPKVLPVCWDDGVCPMPMAVSWQLAQRHLRGVIPACDDWQAEDVVPKVLDAWNRWID